MTQRSLLMTLMLFALATGCGDDGGGDSPDAGPANSLGIQCGTGSPDCPADHSCVMQGVPGGSTTEGYCSPTCSVDADCTDGYAGPGRAICFADNVCTIVCEGPSECPTDLECLPTGGPTDVCAISE